MKLMDLNIDGQIFKVQESMSFIQQNELMELIEDFIDFSKLKLLQDKIENEGKEEEELTIEMLGSILQEGIKLTTFNFHLTKFCLCSFVKEPLITEEILNDPDDPNVMNFAVLGIELVKYALGYIANRALLKKTPMK